MLDRLERLQKIELSPDLLENIPLHKIKRLRRHGERYFADALRDLAEERRYAIMGVCALEWQASIADAVVETHDRIRDKKTGHDQPTEFLRKTSKWHRHLKVDDVRLWEVAVFFHLRDGFRSGDL